MNTRRAMFKDARVRHALAMVFDFEWANANLFYGHYTRTDSYFSNSDLPRPASRRAPNWPCWTDTGTKLPPELFTTPFQLPVTDGSGNNREQMRGALGLLKQAGWKVRDRKLVDAQGNRSASRSCWISRRSSGSPCPTCNGCRAWASRPQCAPSTRRSSSG